MDVCTSSTGKEHRSVSRRHPTGLVVLGILPGSQATTLSAVCHLKFPRYSSALHEYTRFFGDRLLLLIDYELYPAV